MVQALMLCGIGMLAGCLLMLMFFPIVHQRAVRIARQHAVEAVPLAINEIQADKDHLRAQFAMSIRRLEINIEEMRARTAGQKGEIGRQGAEINRLHAELDKKEALIFALRTRDAVRKSIVRRTAKTLLYIYVRSNRKKLKTAAFVASGVAPRVRYRRRSESRAGSGPDPWNEPEDGSWLKPRGERAAEHSGQPNLNPRPLGRPQEVTSALGDCPRQRPRLCRALLQC